MISNAQHDGSHRSGQIVAEVRGLPGNLRAFRVSVPFFFQRLTEPVLASGHWYSSPFVGVALFLANIGYWVFIGVLMIRAISGLPRAAWALVIALALVAAYVGGVIWLYLR